MNKCAGLKWVAIVGGAAALTVAIFAATPRSAVAIPQYSAQSKLACGACHTNPSGGRALTNRGKKFQANGHKL